MVQIAPQHSGSPFGHNSYVPHQEYAYDITHKTGRVTSAVLLMKIDGAAAGIRKGTSIVCPVYTGACVSSATGGVVEGSDMYGQFVRETVGAAGTGKVAFSTITRAPTDVKWANQFGLPYKWKSGAMAGYTITPPAADGDARGTIVQTAPLTTPVELVLDYIADQTNLMGDPYKTRGATAETGSVTLAATATISSLGAVVLTVPVSNPAGAKYTATMPDGHTVRGVAGTPLNHQLSPIWLSQMRGRINQNAANRLIAVGFDNTSIRGSYATVTGTIIVPFEDDPLRAMGKVYDPESGSERDDDSQSTTGRDPEIGDAPVEEPAGVRDGEQVTEPVQPFQPSNDEQPHGDEYTDDDEQQLEPPTSLGTHAAADAWLDQFLDATGDARPEDWDGLTLSNKRARARELFGEQDAD